MIFRQLFDSKSCTYTYLLADPMTHEAALIDPVNSHIDDYLILLGQLELQLKFSLETHVHADHITASGLLRERTGANTAVSQLCGAETADIQMQDGEKFALGNNEIIKAIATPGHTTGSMSFLWQDRLMTGDSLLINGCGRSDFQGGDASTLFESITQRLFTLPDDTLVYPGHDYQGRWVSNIKQERTSNTRLTGKTKSQFIALMDNLGLPKPKLIDEAVPANRYCGLEENERQEAQEQQHSVQSQRTICTAQSLVNMAKQQITEINIEKSKLLMEAANTRIVDTREENEYVQGHIQNAIFLPRGILEFQLGNKPELANKSAPVLLYCRSGNRSALAAMTLQQMGYTNVLSMAGGYEAWKKAGYQQIT